MRIVSEEKLLKELLLHGPATAVFDYLRTEIDNKRYPQVDHDWLKARCSRHDMLDLNISYHSGPSSGVFSLFEYSTQQERPVEPIRSFSQPVEWISQKASSFLRFVGHDVLNPRAELTFRVLNSHFEC